MIYTAKQQCFTQEGSSDLYRKAAVDTKEARVSQERDFAAKHTGRNRGGEVTSTTLFVL